MALRRAQKPTQESKLDATPPWDPRPVRDTEPTTGPWDVLDAPEDGLDRLDLGALRIPILGGLEMRVEVGEGGVVTTVTVLNESGQMQIGVFAAPRTEGIWDEVRDEIAQSVKGDGGSASEADGPFGRELRGKVSAKNGGQQIRFVGVDGPKWFLRAMMVGAPAAGGADAKPFEDTYRGIVVTRGSGPLPVREPVPLTLPKDAAEQIAAAMAAQQVEQS